jgi:hypothetical protein
MEEYNNIDKEAEELYDILLASIPKGMGFDSILVALGTLILTFNDLKKASNSPFLNGSDFSKN